MNIEKLREGKRAMADRCRAVAEAIVKEAGVKKVVEIKPSQRAHAHATARAIYVQPPTTRRRLTTVAHECGHVALNDDGRHRSHRQEYEACVWSFEALRRHGIAVPRKEVESGKRYVRQKIDQAIRRGAKRIDREAARWCGYRLPAGVEAVRHSPLPPKGGRYAERKIKGNEYFSREANETANYVHEHLMDQHRGVLVYGAEKILYGNDGYQQDERVRREVKLLDERLLELLMQRRATGSSFGVSDGGGSWAIVLHDCTASVEELNAMVWEAWLEASGLKKDRNEQQET